MAARVVLSGAGAPVLKVLGAAQGLAGVEVAALFAEPDTSGEIAARAHALGIALDDLARLGRAGEGAAALAAHRPDWLVNANATVLFPAQVLAVPRRGALNLHPGLLPEYAGLHTHQWAIRNGETRFGVTLHWMEPRVDAGPIAWRREVAITPRDTGLSLFLKCQEAGAELVALALAALARGEEPPREPQDLARRRVYRHAQALDGRIDWTRDAARIVNLVRAADYAPFQCPTYTPTTSLEGRPVAVAKARLAPEAAPGPPGRVAAVDARGLTVSAGGDTAVLITAASLAGGPRLQGENLAQALGAAVGRRLGV